MGNAVLCVRVRTCALGQQDATAAVASAAAAAAAAAAAKTAASAAAAAFAARADTSLSWDKVKSYDTATLYLLNLNCQHVVCVSLPPDGRGRRSIRCLHHYCGSCFRRGQPCSLRRGGTCSSCNSGFSPLVCRRQCQLCLVFGRRQCRRQCQLCLLFGRRQCHRQCQLCLLLGPR